MNNDGIFEIALFPIPGAVSFPQTTVPLHVFEQRYRQMTQDCINKNRLLGVCHTKSIERLASRQQNTAKTKEEMYELYKQNLSTFTPEDVFSAGTVEIKETTDDGRHLISIHMLKRFRIIELLEESPYKIARCEEYKDLEFIDFKDSPEGIQNQKDYILKFIKEQLAQQGVDAHEEIIDLESEKSINNFTFKLFKFYRMQEYEMQRLLNSQSSLERLKKLYEFTLGLKKSLKGNF